MKNNIKNRTGIALAAALCLALVSSPTLSQKDDKEEKAPKKPAGKVNTPMAGETGDGKLVINIKVCKGSTVKIPLKFGGQPTPGTFADKKSKNIPPVGDPAQVSTDGDQGSITIQAGKDGGYQEWTGDFTPRQLPAFDDPKAEKPKFRVTVRIWVVDCENGKEIPEKPDDPKDPPDKKKDDGKNPPPPPEKKNTSTTPKTQEKPKPTKPSGSSKPSGSGKTSNESAKNISGLVTEDFKTANGVIRLNLPADMASGDIISGTVQALPNGKNEKEIARNSDELNGCVVELEKQKTSASDKWGKWLIPAAVTALTVIITDRNHHEVARKEIPVNATPTEATNTPGSHGTSTSDRPMQGDLPTVAQVGRPLSIPITSKGDMATSMVKIGGDPAAVLAQSPRQIVVTAPMKTGYLDYEATADGATVKGAVQNIALRTQLTRPMLKPGDAASVLLSVSGSDKPVPVIVTNHTPGIVDMAGGPVRRLMVDPRDGAKVELTGLMAGAFQLEARVDCANTQLADKEPKPRPGLGFAPGNDPLGSDTPSVDPAEKIDKYVRKRMAADAARRKADKEKAAHPGTDDAKDAEAEAQQAESDAGKAGKDLTPQQRKDGNKEIADQYEQAAKQNREYANEDEKKARGDRADAKEYRKDADAESDSDKKKDLNERADKAEERSKQREQDAADERDRARDLDKKAETYKKLSQ